MEHTSGCVRYTCKCGASNCVSHTVYCQVCDEVNPRYADMQAATKRYLNMAKLAGYQYANDTAGYVPYSTRMPDNIMIPIMEAMQQDGLLVEFAGVIWDGTFVSMCCDRFLAAYEFVMQRVN